LFPARQKVAFARHDRAKFAQTLALDQAPWHSDSPIAGSPELNAFFGCDVVYAADTDEVAFPGIIEQMAISQIAGLLGYQEVSAFTHAFKRWTGTAPREARTRKEAAHDEKPGRKLRLPSRL
jgi:AraC-like DNA-binding protein